MSANQQLDDLFLQRAAERGLLTDQQVNEVREELSSRDSGDDLGAHDLVVEKGWIGVDGAMELLEAGPGDTMSDVTARLAGTTERGQPGIHDVEIHPEDEMFDEVPKLVEPLEPRYAMDADSPGSGDSHLEMELPPPESSSGDSIFDEDESAPSLKSLDEEVIDVGTDLSPEPEASLDELDEPSRARAAPLDGTDIDDVVPDEEIEQEFEPEEIVAQEMDPLGAESTDQRLGPVQAEPPLQPALDQSDTRGFDDLYGEGSEHNPAGVTSTDTHGFDEDSAGVQTTDGGLDDPRQATHEFELRGAKGADVDFADYGEEDDPDLVTLEDSDVITSEMSDSAVREVMEQADDTYFGPPADLNATPQETLNDSIAPPPPEDESVLLDKDNLTTMPPHQDEADFVATLPPGIEAFEPTVLDATEGPDVDISISSSDDETEMATFYDTSDTSDIDTGDIGLEEVADDSSVIDMTTSSQTAFATGEFVRPGLRNRSTNRLGVESNVTGENCEREEIHGYEMTLADLRRQMGIGAGVKIGGQSASAVDHLKKGSRRRRYSVVREVARGGMGKVLEVEDNDLRRSVALKVLRREMLERKDLVERFLEEAQITGQLEHPNIVPVHEIGVDGRGNLYFTMKLVEGEELSSILKRLRKNDPSAKRAYPISRLIDVFIKVCEGISFAHSRGVIHRDLKPSNIMVGRFGEVQIMDWGVAKIVGRKEDTVDREVRSDRQDDDSARTMIGSILGTPSYMSPEQARGEINSMGTESDVFSLGVILYEILCLATPWTAQTSAQVLDQVKHFDPAPPSARESGRRIPPELEQLAMKCLDKTPHKRVSTAEELIDDLRKWQKGGTLAAVQYSAGQLIAKWIARHKVAVIMVLLFFVALVGGGITASQYFEQQNLEKANALVAGAKTTLTDAQSAYDIDDFEKAENLARKANGDFTSALRIDENNEEAANLQSDASILAASASSAIAMRAESEREAREQRRRMDEFITALEEARAALKTAHDAESGGEGLSKVNEKFHTAKDEYLEARSIKIKGADDEKTEVTEALSEINTWLGDYERRKLIESDLDAADGLIEDAQGKLGNAREHRQDDRRGEAEDSFNETINLSENAISIALPFSLQDDQAGKLVDKAKEIKACAAHEYALLAMEDERFGLSEHLLNTARNTGKLAEQVRSATARLERQVEAKSKFTRLIKNAEDAINEKKWVVAQSHIRAALKEAETSEYADDKDRESLGGLLELAQLEELRLKDVEAENSEQLTRVLGGYDNLIDTLAISAYVDRAKNRRAEVRSRLGSQLQTEAELSDDIRVKGELYERALTYTEDAATIAEINAELASIKLQLATDNVSDELVLLPRGDFVVGSNREGDNNLQRVYRQNKFVFVDKYLVTNEQFQKFVKDGGYTNRKFWAKDAPSLSEFVDSTGSPGPATWADGGFDDSLAKYPVTGISWFEAAAYAKWAGKRLPTPDEWELAAGAPESGSSKQVGEYPFGERADGPPDGVKETREVGTTEWDASTRGVRDMGSNVSEWTRQRQDGRSIVKGAPPGLRSLLWFRYARRAKNSFAVLKARSADRGFRCAQDFRLAEEDGGND